MTRLRGLLLSLCFCFMATASTAQEDFQIWTVTNVTKQFDERTSANLELQYRYFDGASDFGQQLIRPSLTYQLNDKVSLTAGYVHVTTKPRSGDFTYENRPWQQIGYEIYENDYGLVVSGRTRIEQRFVNTGDDTGWRLRQFLRVEAPFKEKGPLRGVLWNETFVGLNRTDWGQRDGIDQIRTFAGVNFPVAEQVRLETGYLNQIIKRPGDDAINHAFASYLNFRF